jgi:hypothetical protein
VREGTGRAAKLRRLINARMEEMSFRSGVVVVTGVLALAAAVIALTITLGGGHRADAASSAVSASVGPSSAAAQSSAAADPSPSASPTAPQVSPEAQPVADFTRTPGTSPTRAAPSTSPSAATSSPWPTYRPMGLAPSHSLKTPGIHPGH